MSEIGTALKTLYQSAAPEAMRGLPIKPNSFMLVWITSSFLCAVLVAPANGKATSSRNRKKDTTRGETMTKKQSTGLVCMLGSAAAGIHLTLFSPILRGWFYTICLGVLIIVFASGADLFRGNE